VTPDQARLKAALSSDDPKVALTALRDHLAEVIALDPAPRDLAPLARLHRDVVTTLADMAGPQEGSPADAVAAARAARRSGAPAPRPS
jgi:hypothetical protein